MCRIWLIAAAASTIWGQAPSYTAADVVNASNYTAGPFAPNSVLSLFGTDLAYGIGTIVTGGPTLPTELANVSVYVQNAPAPLFYVSPGQINFVIPSNQIAGDVTVAVVRQGVVGPIVTIELSATAPALFTGSGDDAGYALAQDWNAGYALVTPDAPAYPGDVIVLYLTGLGQTEPNPPPGMVPETAASIVNQADLSVLLNGASIDPTLIKYAGVTPGYAGLYQINIFLPNDTPPNPQIQVSLGGQTSPAGVLLAVAPALQPLAVQAR